MFGKERKETREQQINVPIYTTNQVIVPDGCTMEYVGIVQMSMAGRNIVSGKVFDKFQEIVNASGVDAVFGVQIQSIPILTSSEIIVFGTGVRFVQ